VPFQWSDYLQLARFLQGQRETSYSQEAAERSAVSRAYYAAYCHARNYARDREGFVLSALPEDHRRLREHFQNRGQELVARALSTLRQWRNRCDYDDSIAHTDFLVTQSILQAQRVISAPS
jgi:hypothetical protein